MTLWMAYLCSGEKLMIIFWLWASTTGRAILQYSSFVCVYVCVCCKTINLDTHIYTSLSTVLLLQLLIDTARKSFFLFILVTNVVKFREYFRPKCFVKYF